MSATKWVQKHVGGATLDQLASWNAQLQHDMIAERNRMKLSSLRRQLEIVKQEQYRRGLQDGKEGA